MGTSEQDKINMDSNPPLDSAAIEAALASAAQYCQVSLFDSIGSTNEYLLNHPVEVGHAHLCVTESQSSGRGRRGNIWRSAAHKNVMLSLGWSFSSWPQGLTGLSLAVGMVVAERLNQMFNLSVKVKWPNDLMLEGRKLGGILIELSGQPTGCCQVVIGLGLNVHQPDWSQDDISSGAQPSLDYSWQDLHSLGIQADRNRLIGSVVSALIVMLRSFEQFGFSRLAVAWNEYSTYTGKSIVVFDGKEQISGVMRGVDEEGALLVQDEVGNTVRFIDSEVSIRLVDEEQVAL
jgi:BirA family biotin operon repressor/biotin-[acetyl-CoA-carboxylase] ligase